MFERKDDREYRRRVLGRRTQRRIFQRPDIVKEIRRKKKNAIEVDPVGRRPPVIR